MMRRLTAAIVIGLLLVPTAAMAQGTVTPVDQCTGRRHTPTTAGEGFSTLLVAMIMAASAAGLDLSFASEDGAGNPTSTTSIVGDDGAVSGELPLQAFGTVPLAATLDGEPIDLGDDSTVTIDGDEVPCDTTMLDAATPELTTETTTPTVEPTNASAATPTELATPTEVATVPGPPAVIESEPVTVGGTRSRVPFIALSLIGLALLLFGLWDWLRERREDIETGIPDDDGPRDVPVPTFAVYVVTDGDFDNLPSSGNTLVPVVAPVDGALVVGTYFVALQTTINADGGEGHRSETWTNKVGDHTQQVRSRRFRARLDHGADLRSRTLARMSGGKLVNYGWVNATDAVKKLRPRPGVSPTAKDATSLATTVELRVHFVPGSGAPANASLNRVAAASSIGLRAVNSCTWCKDGNAWERMHCDGKPTAIAGGTFQVFAETDGPTPLKYGPDPNLKMAAAGSGAAASLSMAQPKVGATMGPLTLAEIQVVLKEAQHQINQGVVVPGSGSFSHQRGERMTVNLWNKTSAQSSVVVPAGDGAISSGLQAQARAWIQHDVAHRSWVDPSVWPAEWPAPEVEVTLGTKADAAADMVHADVAVVRVNAAQLALSPPPIGAVGDTAFWDVQPPEVEQRAWEKFIEEIETEIDEETWWEEQDDEPVRPAEERPEDRPLLERLREALEGSW